MLRNQSNLKFQYSYSGLGTGYTKAAHCRRCDVWRAEHKKETHDGKDACSDHPAQHSLFYALACIFNHCLPNFLNQFAYIISYRNKWFIFPTFSSTLDANFSCFSMGMIFLILVAHHLTCLLVTYLYCFLIEILLRISSWSKTRKLQRNSME